MEKYRILQFKKNKIIRLKNAPVPETKIIMHNLISDIDYDEMYYDTIIDFNINFPTFDMEYYKEFNLNPNNLNDIKLMYHYATIGNICNQEYLEYDYVIDNYINRFDVSHPLYNKTLDGEAFRNISTNIELKSYFNSRGK